MTGPIYWRSKLSTALFEFRPKTGGWLPVPRFDSAQQTQPVVHSDTQIPLFHTRHASDGRHDSASCERCVRCIQYFNLIHHIRVRGEHKV